MNYERLVLRVRDRTGLESLSLAAMAVSATLEAIGRVLDEDVGPLVRAELPELLGEMLDHGLSSPDRGGAFLSEVAAHEQVGLGFAREHAQVVCESLAGELDGEARERLAALLPGEVAKLLVPYEAPPEVRSRAPERVEPRRNLAEGRPGATRPLSDSAPPAGHQDSPAVTTDPDVETKLSSAKGVSTERNKDTLAEGRPGSHRPLSDKTTP